MGVKADASYIFKASSLPSVKSFLKVVVVHDVQITMGVYTLRVHYSHAAANLKWRYTKVALVHYFCTIALRVTLNTSHSAYACISVV